MVVDEAVVDEAVVDTLAVVDTTVVDAEQFKLREFPASREKTGNFANFGARRYVFEAEKSAPALGFSPEFPKPKNREFRNGEQGIFLGKQGTDLREQGTSVCGENLSGRHLGRRGNRGSVETRL